MKNLSILKFGGTSVSSDEKINRIIEIIKEKQKNNEKLVIVVSAMGRYPDTYATDTFLSKIDDNFKKENKQAADLLISCGEIISSVIIANKLVNANINAVPISGGPAGIITDNNFGEATPIKFKTKYLKKLLKENKVPVITGFQGTTKEGIITTLGRGGSDTTATIIGNMLNAKQIEIYTDVDGIYDKDPNTNKDAKKYEKLTYKEAQELSEKGAKVIHNKAIKYAKEKNIPIIIKSTMITSEGTIIN